jgi:hypothetical protein
VFFRCAAICVVYLQVLLHYHNIPLCICTLRRFHDMLQSSARVGRLLRHTPSGSGNIKLRLDCSVQDTKFNTHSHLHTHVDSGGPNAGFSKQRPAFYPETVCVKYLMDKVILGQVSPRVLLFPLPQVFQQCSTFYLRP